MKTGMVYALAMSMMAMSFSVAAASAGGPGGPGGPPSGSCSLNTSAMNFGNYNVFSSVPLDTTGVISVRCTGSGTFAVIIALENSNTSGSIINRRLGLMGGNDRLTYNLFTDAGRTTIWGDGSGNSVTQAVNVTNNAPVNLTVYGRIPALQDSTIGLYGDNVTVNVTF